MVTDRVTIECKPSGDWFLAIDGKLVGDALPSRKHAECVRIWLARHLLDVLTFPKTVTGTPRKPLTEPYRKDDPTPDKHGAAMAAQILEELRRKSA